jgi:two-component system nitrogen regulation response regulator GlnG
VPSGAPVTAAVDGADAPAALGGGDVSRVQPSVGAATLASAPVAAASNGAPAGYPMWESGCAPKSRDCCAKIPPT